MEMKIFEIEIKETLLRKIDIESESLEEALFIVNEKYNNEEIVLDFEDHINTDFDISTLNQLENDTNFTNYVLRRAEEMIINLSVEEMAKLGFGSLMNAKEEYEKTK